MLAGIGQGAYSLPGNNRIGENGGLLSACGVFCATTDGYVSCRLGVSRCVKIFEFWVNGTLPKLGYLPYEKSFQVGVIPLVY